MDFSKFESFFDKNHKKLMIIPILLLIFSIAVPLIKYSQTGEFVQRSVELKGGISVTINKQGLDYNSIESSLKETFKDISIRKVQSPISNNLEGLEIEVGSASLEEVTLALDKLNINDKILTKDEFTIGDTSSKFGEDFYSNLLRILVISFVLMSITVFIAFRSLYPSMAVISSVILDIAFPFAMVSLLGINLTAGGIIAFLLVIAYSVDTDILLTNSLLNKKHLPHFERLTSSMKTGLTMTFTTLFAVIPAYFVSSSEVLQQMFLIIAFALIADIISTYLFNAPLLWAYIKRKNIS